MSLKSSMVSVRVLLVRVPLVMLVIDPSLSTSSIVPFTSQVMLGVGEASTMQEKDTLPPATPLACEIEMLTVGGTRDVKESSNKMHCYY